MKHLLVVQFAASLLGTLLPLSARSAQDTTESIDLPARLSAGGIVSHNRSIKSVQVADRPAVELDARAGDGLAWVAHSDFATGEIECDIQGRNIPQASFVGLAFHGDDDGSYEAIYFRPFNFGSTVPAQRGRAVQYICMPDFDWQTLRQTRPGVFESGVAPDLKPDAWFHARVVVTAIQVSVFVNDAAEPCLVVDRLSDRHAGFVGLWVGNGSNGIFANLRITPQP